MNYSHRSYAAVSTGLLCLSLCLSLYNTSAQKQLVLLKKEKILLRLEYGDDIAFRIKGSHDVVRSYVNNIYDTAVVVHKTVVPFHKIERLYFANGTFLNVIGTLLVVGGVGYFAIDQLNEIVVQGEGASLDRNVTTASIAMVATGLPLMLIKKKSQRMKRGYRLLAVDGDSPFYRHEFKKGIGEK